jgi:hypothetical protein
MTLTMHDQLQRRRYVGWSNVEKAQNKDYDSDKPPICAVVGGWVASSWFVAV